MKLLRVVSEISSYPHLAAMYKILASLAVTSTSAERILSRVRIIKNRLRTSMVDEWFSALTILAAEQDILKSISTEEIINSFSQCSSGLREYLVQKTKTDVGYHVQLNIICFIEEHRLFFLSTHNYVTCVLVSSCLYYSSYLVNSYLVFYCYFYF